MGRTVPVLPRIRHILPSLKLLTLILVPPVVMLVLLSVQRPDWPYLDLSCSQRVMNVREQFKRFDFNDRWDGRYSITWYDIPFFHKARPATFNRTFDSCEYKNCVVSISRADACYSHAVIFKGRFLPRIKHPVYRPVGQVWIFAEEESPLTYNLDTGMWKLPGYRGAFNWTMTYDRKNTDIYLPYGEIVKRSKPEERDFLSIAKSKTKDAVIITSHCNTYSKRLEYINELQKYINVDVLGECGEPWNCGEVWIHDDDCFSLLNNSYRFYLAFENAFCRGYRTEKLFENFKYDLLLVTRGDMSSSIDDPKHAYISSSDFKSVADLGRYLKSLSDSPEKYAEMLRRKSMYVSLPYEEVYQKALCDICKRLNFQEYYKKTIVDLDKWRDVDNACYPPSDI